jgi:hypothetical protein
MLALGPDAPNEVARRYANVDDPGPAVGADAAVAISTPPSV